MELYDSIYFKLSHSILHIWKFRTKQNENKTSKYTIIYKTCTIYNFTQDRKKINLKLENLFAFCLKQNNNFVVAVVAAVADAAVAVGVVVVEISVPWGLFANDKT